MDLTVSPQAELNGDMMNDDLPGASPVQRMVRRGGWERGIEGAISLVAAACVYVTFRAIAPHDILWWQGVAMGASSMMIARIWWHVCESA